jgi:hypothetical protein
VSRPITLAQQAAHYAQAREAAVAALPALIAEREAAEADWAKAGGSVRMWCARDAVDRQHRHIARMTREANTHALLLDLCKGAKR